MRSRALHPYLFGAFPALFLYARNSDEYSLTSLIIPLLVIALAVWIALRLSGLVVSDRTAAALLVSLAVLLFFSYSQVRDAVAGLGVAERLGTDRSTLALSGLVLLAGVVAARRLSGRLAGATAPANAAAAALVLFNVAEIGWRAWDAHRMTGEAALARPLATASAPPAPARALPERLPDIYYIVLDAYGRSDVLRDRYRADDRSFLRGLEQRGFYIARGSRANYVQTLLSLAATLNFGYLDSLGARLGDGATVRRPLLQMILHSRLVGFLRERGYRFVAFDAGYEFHNAPLVADEFLAPGSGSLGELDAGLLNMSALRPLVDRWAFRSLYDDHRARVTYTLNSLGRLPPRRAPQFVLAHIMAPHPPFVFGRHGEPLEPARVYGTGDGSSYLEQPGATAAEYVAGYGAEVGFLDSAVTAAIDRILAQSARRALVIIAGDHGPRLTAHWERLDSADCQGCFGILNAFYFPGGDGGVLYPTISPVNTFRAVLNRYFDARLPLLADVSHLSTWRHPYQWLVVSTDPAPAAPQPALPTSPTGSIGERPLRQMPRAAAPAPSR